jgi:7-cyano-7-deazaguanine synthase in queuosine biosynthesis
VPSGSERLDVVVKDEYTDAALVGFTIDQDTLILSFSGPKPNVVNDIGTIEQRLGHRVSSAVLDLYNIALVVYVSDLHFKRKPKIGYRSIHVLMSVFDKARWDLVKNHLESTLRDLMNGDIVLFDFVQRKPLAPPFSHSRHDTRVASLFSGGLDSLAGAKWLLDNNMKPILISHCSEHTICAVQARLAEAVSKLSGGKVEFCRISARKTFQQNETSQFSRSFLYLTLAAIFALELKLAKIFVFENGVISVNLPISPGRVFGNTRTTHPAFLIAYEELLKKAFSAEINVVNPFLELTKGEVVKLLNHDGYRGLVRASISCSERGHMRFDRIKTSEVTHCGKCLPCIIRRASVHHAGVWDYDAKYEVDLTAVYRAISPDAIKIVVQLLDFGNRFQGCRSDSDAIFEWGQLRVHENIDPSPIVAMYRRSVSEFRSFIRDKADPNFKAKLTGL